MKIYTDINEYGVAYAILIVPALLLLLDTYFFWHHYLMHRSFFSEFSKHNIHHTVHNVSPWSAFSVHPIEGFVEILSRPLILFLIPLHPYSIISFLVLTFALNIIGHSGYEFFHKSYAKGFGTKYLSSATFHYMHHQQGNYNFSLFFNIWDRLLNTIHPDYESFYMEVKNKQKQIKIS